MSKTRELNLRAGLREITGDGEELVFVVSAWRENAAGNSEQYELKLRACRHSVRVILRELRKMHLRDRERLTREKQRIDREILELTQEQ